jgi:hypothetical protein
MTAVNVFTILQEKDITMTTAIIIIWTDRFQLAVTWEFSTNNKCIDFNHCDNMQVLLTNEYVCTIFCDIKMYPHFMFTLCSHMITNCGTLVVVIVW